MDSGWWIVDSGKSSGFRVQGSALQVRSDTPHTPLTTHHSLSTIHYSLSTLFLLLACTCGVAAAAEEDPAKTRQRIEAMSAEKKAELLRRQQQFDREDR